MEWGTAQDDDQRQSRSQSKDSIYSSAVAAEKDRLFGLSDEELRGLPGHSSREMNIEGVTVSLSTWHQPHPEGFEVFVAQAKRYIFLGYGHMFVDGFILRANGKREPLPTEVYYEYA